MLGCTHVFDFPTAKLLDFEPDLAALKRQSNPFTLVTAAHLSALRTRLIDLFVIIDWMLALPKELEQKVCQDIDEIERKAQMK